MTGKTTTEKTKQQASLICEVYCVLDKQKTIIKPWAYSVQGFYGLSI